MGQKRYQYSWNFSSIYSNLFTSSRITGDAENKEGTCRLMDGQTSLKPHSIQWTKEMTLPLTGWLLVLPMHCNYHAFLSLNKSVIFLQECRFGLRFSSVTRLVLCIYGYHHCSWWLFYSKLYVIRETSFLKSVAM